jgi:hypothetical protein
MRVGERNIGGAIQHRSQVGIGERHYFLLEFVISLRSNLVNLIRAKEMSFSVSHSKVLLFLVVDLEWKNGVALTRSVRN